MKINNKFEALVLSKALFTRLKEIENLNHDLIYRLSDDDDDKVREFKTLYNWYLSIKSEYELLD